MFPWLVGSVSVTSTAGLKARGGPSPCSTSKSRLSLSDGGLFDSPIELIEVFANLRTASTRFLTPLSNFGRLMMNQKNRTPRTIICAEVNMVTTIAAA